MQLLNKKIPKEPWFSKRSNMHPLLHPKRIFTISGDICGCHTWEGADGMWWKEDRDAARQPARHRTVLQQRVTAPEVSAASGWREAALPIDNHLPKPPFVAKLDT